MAPDKDTPRDDSLLLGKREKGRARQSVEVGWRVLGWFGWAILLVGVIDLVLVWYPIRSGNPAWEFGAVDSSMSTAPVVLVGLMGIVASALNGGRRWVVVVVGLIATILSLAVVGELFLYWTDVPIALEQVPEQAASGIRKSIVRTTAFGLTTLTVTAITAVLTLRYAFTRTGGR